MDVLRVFVGYDPREAAAYHVFCQSVIEKTAARVAFLPLTGKQRDGSNAFTFARYLVPHLCDFTGWALFVDGDMVCEADIAELWAWRNTHYDKAICVVKHEYTTRHPRKYIGSSMESPNMDYPRKNWSSVMLWNCAHFANRVLTPEYVESSTGAHLHRLGWLEDKAIGALAPGWNYLVGEDPPGPAYLYHYTLGVPGIRHYSADHASWKWHQALLNALECAGENPVDVVKRSYSAVR